MVDYISVDIDEITKTQDQFGKGARIPRIKINPGEEKDLRIVKAPQDRMFFVVRTLHWGIPVGMGKTPPQTCSYKHFGTSCYFCEVTNEYYNCGDPRKADIARRIRANTGYVSNVLDLNDPTNDDGTPKVQLWQYSEAVFKEIMFYVKNREEYGDIFHPESGRDIRLQSEIVGTSGDSTYTKHKIKVRGKPSALPDITVFDYLYDLEKERPVKQFSYEQQRGIFDGTIDCRSGESKALPGNGHGVPQLIEPSASVEDEFESHEGDATFEESGIPAQVESEATVEASESNEDEWETVMAEDDAGTDEKVADIKAKLKAALNKKQ